jgi:hypothetical protein
MNTKLEDEINSEEEMNLYDYWKILVKRKKIFIGIFLIPLVMVTIISLSLPRYYRGEAEINYSASPVSIVSPASNIVKLMGDIDDRKKTKIFTNNPGAIRSVLISLPKTSNDKIKIIVEAKTSDIIPQAFKEIFDYINNYPEIKGEIARIKEETDFKIKKFKETRNANLIFLNQLTDMMKKEQLTAVNINPADLIKKDVDLSTEIKNLQDAISIFGTLGPLSITMQPSCLQIRKIIISVGALSLVAAIFVVFFLLEYIERIKTRENK